MYALDIALLVTTVPADAPARTLARLNEALTFSGEPAISTFAGAQKTRDRIRSRHRDRMVAFESERWRLFRSGVEWPAPEMPVMPHHPDPALLSALEWAEMADRAARRGDTIDLHLDRVWDESEKVIA